MFHCHNLVHEDHDMMAAFNVSDIDLTEYGYPEATKFSDPMAPLFTSKKYTGTDMGQIQNVLLPYFQNMGAYPDAQKVEKALEDYWKDIKTTKKASSSSVPSTSSTATPSTLSTVTTTPLAKVAATTTSKAPATTSKCDDKGKGKSTCK